MSLHPSPIRPVISEYGYWNGNTWTKFNLPSGSTGVDSLNWNAAFVSGSTLYEGGVVTTASGTVNGYWANSTWVSPTATVSGDTVDGINTIPAVSAALYIWAAISRLVPITFPAIGPMDPGHR